MTILLGVFIGIIMSLIAMIIIRKIYKKYEMKEYLNFENILEPLVYLLIDNNIIKNGTKYFEDIENKSIFVLINNEIKQYTYKNTKEEILEINCLKIPENLLNIIDKHIVWNTVHGINSMYLRSTKIYQKNKRKKRKI
jgi:chromate transport protein ChrA